MTTFCRGGDDCPRDACDGDLEHQDRFNVLCLGCERVYTHYTNETQDLLVDEDLETVARKARVATDGGAHSSGGAERDLARLIFENLTEYFQWIGVSERFKILFDFIRKATLVIELFESYNGLFNIRLSGLIVHRNDQAQLIINLTRDSYRLIINSWFLSRKQIKIPNHLETGWWNVYTKTERDANGGNRA